jgi:threonine dehydratase
MNLTLPMLLEARKLLRPYLPCTRLVAAPSITRGDRSVFLKLESELPTGSFKPRGALYALATELARRPVREVAASSTGNHGAAVAFAAKELHVPATIFLPENPNPVKRARIAQLGAVIKEGGKDIVEAFQRAAAYSQKDGTYFLNDATDPDLPAGPATIAAEIFEQHPATETIVAPMGDTALIRGLAAAAKLISVRVKILGVQAERAPSYALSWKQGRAVPTDTCDTIADGLATRTPDARNVAAIRALVDQVYLVSEDHMLAAIRHLLLEEHLVAEPAGAAACAAILQNHDRLSGQIVAIVSGANISPEVLRRAASGTLSLTV